MEVIECFDATMGGKPLWTYSYATRYRDDFGFDDGPRGTPAIEDHNVYAFGAEGTLTCVQLGDGKLLWSVPTATEYHAGKGFFGFACSPLVHGGVVLVNVGGSDGAGIIGFDASTGKMRWKASQHEAGYSSPVMATIAGQSRAVFFTRQGLVVLDPGNGAVTTEFPWRSRISASVNAATPLMLGERVFLTSSYGTGAILLDLHGAQPATVWSGDDSLSSHYASVVAHDGYLYGFHGRQETGASLRCVEAATGKVKWSIDGYGCGSLILAQGTLLLLTERGELVVGPISPTPFQPVARFQILGAGTRSPPALSDGRFYARDTKRLVCLDLRGL
jgi:outer membrane protein assembly factor BamB